MRSETKINSFIYFPEVLLALYMCGGVASSNISCTAFILFMKITSVLVLYVGNKDPSQYLTSVCGWSNHSQIINSMTFFCLVLIWSIVHGNMADCTFSLCVKSKFFVDASTVTSLLSTTDWGWLKVHLLQAISLTVGFVCFYLKLTCINLSSYSSILIKSSLEYHSSWYQAKTEMNEWMVF